MIMIKKDMLHNIYDMNKEKSVALPLKTYIQNAWRGKRVNDFHRGDLYMLCAYICFEGINFLTCLQSIHVCIKS